MNLQHLQPAIAIRHANLDLTVKSARPTQSRIYRIRTIRRPDHHHLSPRLETIHQRQELRRNSFLYLSSDLFSLRCDRINFVDEDDRRGILLCFLENVPQPLLALTVILAHDLRPTNTEKVRVPPNLSNTAGCLNGSSIISRTFWITGRRPPMSS